MSFCSVQPHRTIYFAFGHDEEVSGGFGAAAMAKLLEEQGVEEFDHILDEGGTVLVDGLKGLLSTPVAIIGTAEKVANAPFPPPLGHTPPLPSHMHD